MTIDLLLGTVFNQEATEHSDTADPDQLGRSTGVLGTSALTRSTVSSLSLGSRSASGASARVHNWGLFQNETILDELPHILSSNISQLNSQIRTNRHTRVGHRDFVDFIWIHPNLSLATFQE